MDFDVYLFKSVGQIVDPVLFGRRRGTEQRHRFGCHASLGHVLEDDGNQLCEARKLLIDDDRDVIVGRERAVEGGEAQRRLQGLSKSGQRISQGRDSCRPAHADHVLLSDLDVEMFSTICDADAHGWSRQPSNDSRRHCPPRTWG